MRFRPEAADCPDVTPNVPQHDHAARTEVLRSRPAQAVAVLYVLFGCYYLWWRATQTVNWDAPFISIPFLFADFLGFAFFLLFAATLWARWKRYAPAPEEGLAVDVYVTTYNEPVDVLRPTITAAVSMDYPHETYVLDDGRRPEVEALCESLGARYLSRPDNKGAKAGNINAALPRTSGDIIAIFDADHVPFRNFLTELLGYFRDQKVGLVQAPQAYYNLDSFQHGVRQWSHGNAPWHEQSVFYDAIMPGKERWNAAFWCGSSGIVRRAALEGVGGVDTRTVTEDMHTAMSMHAAGWKSIYHDRELALGIAPDDVGSFLLQRFRWAQGSVQMLRADNPLAKRGLNLKQRLAYLASTLYVAEYVPKAIYLATPILALTFGALPMTNMGWSLLYRFLPYYLLGITATMMLARGTNPYFQAERFHLLKMGIMLRALTLLVWPRKLAFNVTPKAGDGEDHRKANLGLVKGQMIAGVASLAAIAWAVTAWRLGVTWQLTGVSLAITITWALFNAAMVADLVRWVLRRPHRRKLYRFDVDLPIAVSAEGGSAIGRARDVSAAGLGWESPFGFRSGEEVLVRLQLGEGLPFEARTRVMACRESGGGFLCGAEFVELDRVAQFELVLFLYQELAPGTLHPLSRRKVPGEVVELESRWRGQKAS